MDSLREKIMDEAYGSRYYIYPGEPKYTFTCMISIGGMESKEMYIISCQDVQIAKMSKSSIKARVI